MDADDHKQRPRLNTPLKTSPAVVSSGVFHLGFQ